MVNSHALPGKVPEKLEIDVEGDVLPAQLAAEHAAKFPDNVHPVSPLKDPCPGTQHGLAVVTWVRRTQLLSEVISNLMLRIEVWKGNSCGTV